jgi:hypothetical protein
MAMAPKTPQRRLTCLERSKIHTLRYHGDWNYLRIFQYLDIPHDAIEISWSTTSPTDSHCRGR